MRIRTFLMGFMALALFMVAWVPVGAAANLTSDESSVDA